MRENARKLRAQQTDAERRLWHLLRNRQIGGAKFRRQHPFGPFILDFYCHEAGLVVELDGGHHFEDAQEMRDAQRTEWLEAQGLRVVRFTNTEVLFQADGVVHEISLRLDGPHP